MWLGVLVTYTASIEKKFFNFVMPFLHAFSVPRSEEFALRDLATLIGTDRRFSLSDDGGHECPPLTLEDVAEDCEYLQGYKHGVFKDPFRKPQHERALPPGEILIEAWHTKLAEMVRYLHKWAPVDVPVADKTAKGSLETRLG